MSVRPGAVVDFAFYVIHSGDDRCDWWIVNVAALRAFGSSSLTG